MEFKVKKIKWIASNMAAHFRILAWEISWAEEPGRL